MSIQLGDSPGSATEIVRPAASEGRHLRESLALWTFVGVAACAFAFYTLIYGRDLYIGTDDLLLPPAGRPE